jgi:hypothetical protein
MRILAAEPPGAEKPPTLPPAAKTLWQGMIGGFNVAAASICDHDRGPRR